MANLLDRFNKTVKGARGRISDFKSTISASGDFTRITDLEVILNSWNNILLTPTRTYMWDPDYGSDLYKMVFEPADAQTQERIKEEVEDKLSRYDDRAVINSVEVTFLRNRKGFNVAIDVSYRGTTGELKVTFDQDQYTSFLEAV
jgi:phage baseplate assembly protein W